MNKSDKNVVIFGESGSGKSSLVNLLLQESRAKVSDKAVGCTFTFQKYETPFFNLYDTVGLSEGSKGTVNQDYAVNSLIKLLTSLEEGVSILVFVIEKGRIKKSLQDNYKLFVDTICMKKVPVVLVITRCEMESRRGTWWEQNKKHFDNYGMSFIATVSGSSAQPDSVPEIMQPIIKDINAKTMAELLQALTSNWLTHAWICDGGWTKWLYTIFKEVIQIMETFFGLPSFMNFASLDSKSFQLRLIAHFLSLGHDNNEALVLTEHIVSALNKRSQ